MSGSSCAHYSRQTPDARRQPSAASRLSGLAQRAAHRIFQLVRADIRGHAHLDAVDRREVVRCGLRRHQLDDETGIGQLPLAAPRADLAALEYLEAIAIAQSDTAPAHVYAEHGVSVDEAAETVFSVDFRFAPIDIPDGGPERQAGGSRGDPLLHAAPGPPGRGVIGVHAVHGAERQEPDEGNDHGYPGRGPGIDVENEA